MKETIKSVLVNYITCAIIGGVLEFFVPQRMKKTLHVAVVAVMLVAAFSPVLKMDFDFDSIDYSVEAESEITYDNLMHIANLTEKKIYNEMKQILINQQVNEYEIYVRTSVEKDENTVYLDEVKIEIPEEFKDKISAITKAVPVEYKSVFTISVR